jgi:type II secretory pathway component GspD/PulD (secretin)
VYLFGLLVRPLPFVLIATACARGVAAQGPTALPDLPVSSLELLAQPPSTTRPQTTPVTQTAGLADLDGPRTVSLTFARPVPVREVLVLLVRGTPFSAVLDPGVRATFSGELRNLTARQALEAVLFPASLDYEVRGTVIHAFPARTSTGLFKLDLLAVRRSWSSTINASSDSMSASVDSDAFAEIDRGVAALLSKDGRHHVDRRAALVQVTDYRDRLEQVALYLETVQVRALRQVRIDARIYRLTLRDGLAARDSRATPTIVDDIRHLMPALEQSGTVELVAAPALIAVNNETAMMMVEAAQSLSLAVTPQISADGFVQLGVVPRIAARPIAPDTTASTLSASSSVMRLREGETVMISGLPGGQAPRHEWIVLLTPSFVEVPRTIQAGPR